METENEIKKRVKELPPLLSPFKKVFHRILLAFGLIALIFIIIILILFLRG